MESQKPATIDAYIAAQPVESQEKLRILRKVIQECAPQATEKMSWAMPTFYLNGNLVHFALAKKHIGFYPAPSAIEHFAEQLRGYKTSKGAIQFSLDKDLPLDLIRDIVAFRVAENTKA